MMAGIGHNSGQVIAAGHSWRKHVWTRARADLLPKLPIEVIRLRVNRAAELGLHYKTYAGIRASTGHDLLGFLFSSNALRVLRDGQPLPADRIAMLGQLRNARRSALVHPPVTVDHMARMDVLDRAFAAPGFADSWAAMRDRIKTIVTAEGGPADRLVMIGDTAFEHDWAEAGRMAGYLGADAFFGAPSGGT
ncbi:hypothetical protein [Yoonia sp.]|uniref:hypothetical protein n=1 Tax=Yoonia sp. TaxID=2212373 RepID=UPI002FDAEE5C